MAATGLEVFDRSLHKTNEIFVEIEKEMGWEDRHQTYAAFRTVLHALRDRMTVQETADFSAQLPLVVKGVLFEGWNPSVVPVKMNLDEFFDRIRSQFQWSMDRSIRDLVIVVLQAIGHFSSEGQMNDVAAILPKQLAELVREATATR